MKMFKHIIRVNAFNHGFSLYAGNPKNGFRLQNLNVISDDITQSYLKLQQKIDNILDTKKTLWTLSFRQDSLSEKPLIGYGIYVEDGTDDRGRMSGLYFIHAIEIPSSQLLFVTVGRVITFLSSFENSISNQISDVATGKIKIEAFLLEITRSLENTPNKNFEINNSHNIDLIDNIKHDYIGSEVLAWLINAFNLNGMNPPWEVYDVLDNEQKIITLSNLKNTKEPIDVSDVVYILTDNYYNKSSDPISKINESEQISILLTEIQKIYHKVSEISFQKTESITSNADNFPKDLNAGPFPPKHNLFNKNRILIYLFFILLIFFNFYQLKVYNNLYNSINKVNAIDTLVPTNVQDKLNVYEDRVVVYEDSVAELNKMLVTQQAINDGISKKNTEDKNEYNQRLHEKDFQILKLQNEKSLYLKEIDHLKNSNDIK